MASLLEAERREAQVQGNPAQVSCGGVLGCTQGPGRSLPAWLLPTLTCLLPGPRVLPTRWSGQQTGLTTKCHVRVSSLSSGDLHMGVGAGRGCRHYLCVCWSARWVCPVQRGPGMREGAPAPSSSWGRRSTSPGPSTAEASLSLDLGNGANPTSAPPPCSPQR